MNFLQNMQNNLSNQNYLIDTHAHIYLCQEPEEKIIQETLNQNIKKIINVGINIDTSIQSAITASKFPHIVYPTFGIHPSEYLPNLSLDYIVDLINKYPYKAIGEIGLDYFHMNHSVQQQKELFILMLESAKKTNLPVIIHNRHSDEDLFQILTKYQDIPKVIHCYSSTPEFALKFDPQNTFFSFTGNITYAKKGKIINTIKSLPLSQIMLETDSPYLTPQKYKGSPNKPSYLIEIASKIASIKNISLTELSTSTTQNALKFFNLN